MSLEFNAFHVLLLLITVGLGFWGLRLIAGLMVGGPLEPLGNAMLAIFP